MATYELTWSQLVDLEFGLKSSLFGFGLNLLPTEDVKTCLPTYKASQYLLRVERSSRGMREESTAVQSGDEAQWRRRVKELNEKETEREKVSFVRT